MDFVNFIYLSTVAFLAENYKALDDIFKPNFAL